MSSQPPTGPQYPTINPPPRSRPVAQAPHVQTTEAPPAAKPEPEPKTIKVIENGKLKHRPTGDHEVGFGRTSEKTRFQPGCKPGPGRRKGSKSQDSLLKAELLAKQTVRENGRSRKVTKREVLAKLVVNKPLETRNHKELMTLHNEARRFFPDVATEATEAAAFDQAADLQVIRQVMEHLRFGEPAPDNADPLADCATGGPDLGHSDSDAWNEGDWNAEPKGTSDDDR